MNRTKRISQACLVLLVWSSMLAWSASATEKNSDSQATKVKQATVLITGANRGLGLGLARHYQQQGYRVIGTARNPARAQELKQLGCDVEQLDVTDATSVNALAIKLSNQPIDLIINNAGIGGHSTPGFADLNVEKLKSSFDVNSLGALRVTQTLWPNIKAGSGKKIISISSRMGSISQNSRPSSLGYRASKAALNSFNKSLANEFSDMGYTFVVLHPGWVRTDMTSERATYTPDQSAAKLFKLIEGLSNADSGRFLDLHGESIDW